MREDMGASASPTALAGCAPSPDGLGPDGRSSHGAKRDYIEIGDLAYRKMMTMGSARLLRAMRGEPEPDERPLPTMRQAIKIVSTKRRRYTPMSERPIYPLPSSVRAIVERVAEAFDISADEVLSKSRARPAIHARSVIIRLIRNRKWESGEHKHSTTTIGRFVNRDHSTVCHSLDHFDTYCKHFPEVGEIYARLSAEESVAA